MSNTNHLHCNPHDTRETSSHRHAGLRYKKRLCITCRAYHPPALLIRVTRTNRVNKQSTWHVNPPSTIHGRSAYCCKNTDCLKQALRQRRFSKALKSAMPDGIVKDLDRLLQSYLSPPETSDTV